MDIEETITIEELETLNLTTSQLDRVKIPMDIGGLTRSITASNLVKGNVEIWDINNTYKKNDIVKKLINNNIVLFFSLVDNNTANDPDADITNTYWKPYLKDIEKQLNWRGIGNSVLRMAPGSGISGNILTIKAGTEILIADNFNTDGSFKNTYYKTTTDLTLDIGGAENYNRYIIIEVSNTPYLGFAKEYSSIYNSNELAYQRPYSSFRFSYNGNKLYFCEANTNTPRAVNGVVLGRIRAKTTIFDAFSSNVALKSDLVSINTMEPSNNYINLTLGADGSQYIAPENGWFMVSKQSSSNTSWQYLQIINQNNTLRVNMYSQQSNAGLKLIMPVKRGDTIAINYTTGGMTEYFRFVYASKI